MITNIWITIGIIVFLMLLDYYLTLKGFRLYSKEYSKKVKSESYELNPMFRKAVKKFKYNYLHLVSMIMVSFFVWLVYFMAGLSGNYTFFFLLQGMVFSMFAYVNSKHVQNILTIKAVNKKPAMIKGKTTYSLEFSLKSGIIQTFSLFLILLFVFIMVPSAFTLGFAIGPIVLILKQRKWLGKAKK